jgi:hypothetical protein
MALQHTRRDVDRKAEVLRIGQPADADTVRLA